MTDHILLISIALMLGGVLSLVMYYLDTRSHSVEQRREDRRVHEGRSYYLVVLDQTGRERARFPSTQQGQCNLRRWMLWYGAPRDTVETRHCTRTHERRVYSRPLRSTVPKHVLQAEAMHNEYLQAMREW